MLNLPPSPPDGWHTARYIAEPVGLLLGDIEYLAEQLRLRRPPTATLFYKPRTRKPIWAYSPEAAEALRLHAMVGWALEEAFAELGPPGIDRIERRPGFKLVYPLDVPRASWFRRRRLKTAGRS